MDAVTIDSPEDRTFPFRRSLFEDPTVVYHGTWSNWSRMIERDGLRRGAVPFDWRHIATIYEADRSIGRGSQLPMFLGNYPREEPPMHLYFSASFWFARAYATDGGGESIRLALEEADFLDSFLSSPERIGKLRSHWELGLMDGEDARTRAAVDVLSNPERLSQIAERVRGAATALRALTAGGYPVVYAVQIEPDWFGEVWRKRLESWGRRQSDVNLRCLVEKIDVARIVAKVSYPNRTDGEFLPAWIATWDDVLALPKT
jgi:hypothetical protein